jgi:HEPN domain-containing protein
MGGLEAIEIDLRALEQNYRDAKGYHHRAEQCAEEGRRHGLIFNIASIALERYLIALCELYGEIPDNHNYNSLMDAVENVVEFPSELNKEIRSLDDIFGICSIDNYYHGAPEPTDADRVLALCDNIKRYSINRQLIQY